MIKNKQENVIILAAIIRMTEKGWYDRTAQECIILADDILTEMEKAFIKVK